MTNKQIKLVYLHTDKMVADILTKNLPREKFEKFRDDLGVVRISTSTRVGVSKYAMNHRVRSESLGLARSSLG